MGQVGQQAKTRCYALLSCTSFLWKQDVKNSARLQLMRLWSQYRGWEAVVCREMFNKYKLMRLNEDEQLERMGSVHSSAAGCSWANSSRSRPRARLVCILRLACKVINLFPSRRTCLDPFIEETVWKNSDYSFIYQIPFCDFNELYQCTARDVSELNYTAAKHIMPLIAESGISC